MLLLFMEKGVHKTRCIPGASSIFTPLSVGLDAGTVMPFGRRRVEPCRNEAAFPRSRAEALLPQGPRAQAALATAPGDIAASPAPSPCQG